MQYPAYMAFEREVRKRFGGELRAGRFDVVHRITPMSPTLPSPLARKCPVPFVLGPLNGGLRWPPGFGQELRREREWLTHIRALHTLLPGYRSTYRHAAAILAAFPHTVADLPAWCRDRVIDFPEVGVDPALFTAPPARAVSGPATVLFAGRLVPYKCPDVVVAAFGASENLRRHRLVIVGDGPERPRLERMIGKLNLGGCVEMLGWKSQAEVAALMREADIFAFPSIRELGAGAVVEAMASGLACVVVDYGGPGGLVDASRGVKVALGTKEDLTARFTRALATLAGDWPRTAALGAAARAHALDRYSWPAKARRTMDVYAWALDRGRAKPAFAPALPDEPCVAAGAAT
jgi:glycosyltransferase involved in cell wall biosynthesis